MAEVRCPKCGRNNPDSLEICQFCQTPLKPESVLRIGDTPIKKNTGELESVLPEWLKDVRQQARDSAQEEAAQAARRKPQKHEPPDLLAGLASQAESADEEEVPDWLAKINPVKPKSPSTSEPETDFLEQFNQSESKPADKRAEPADENVLPWADHTSAQSPAAEDKDELSEWFLQAAEEPEEMVEFDSQSGLDAGWANTFDSPLPSPKEPTPKEEEDLSWLRNLEEAAKQTGDLKAPKQGTDWSASFETPATPSQPSGSQEDLSWLDSLGGLDEPQQPTAKRPPASQDDLSWLNHLGGTPEAVQPFDAAPDQPVASRPFSSEEDLSWLNNLGSTSQPFDASASDASAKPFSEEDLSWLNDLGATAESSQPLDSAASIPSTPQEEPSWLRDLGGEPEPLSTPPFAETDSVQDATAPRQTAPLSQKESQEPIEPDWLKSAAEAPSMPAPGDLSMDWFSHKDQPAEEKPVPSTAQPPSFADPFPTPSETPPLSNQDVDSLFSMEMPDWLSRPETAAEQPSSPQTPLPPAESEGSLTPVDLPSWVQAMRPVEAVISETAAGTADQPEEEGPLAGLRGVIPVSPIGSARKPKAISLKLQASEEQQTSAALLEQILGSETSPRALVTAPVIASQQVLRWALAGLFLLVLGAVIGLRSQRMPVSPSLPDGASNVSNVVTSLPAGAKVLVIIDYEPSLAGEMEATGGPVLDQMVLSSQPNLSFISTSPNGSALAERLMTHTKINTPDGFGYQSGVQYLNLGYLPGGAAGVLGFLEGPGAIIPASGVGSFSEYTALIVMTDQAESGRVWVEQLQNRRQTDLALANQPLLVVASAQAGPLLQPYLSSGQISGMVSGLPDAARYEFLNNGRPGIARTYWDAFGMGLTMAIALIIIGSLWSVFAGIRARRAEAQ